MITVKLCLKHNCFPKWKIYFLIEDYNVNDFHTKNEMSSLPIVGLSTSFLQGVYCSGVILKSRLITS